MADQLNFNSCNPADYGIPCSFGKDFTYRGGGASNDDDIATITYLGLPDFHGNSPILGVLTFTYVGSTNNILSIRRTT